MTTIEIESIINGFAIEINSIETQLLSQLKRLIANENLSNAELSVLIGELDLFSELNAFGFGSSVNELMKKNENIIIQAVNKARAQKLDVSKINLDNIIALSRMQTAQILRRGAEYGNELKQAILRTLITGTPRTVIINSVLPMIQQTTPFLPNWFIVALNQSFTAMNNAAIAVAFQSEPETRFKLIHIWDSHTRDLCKHAMRIMEEHPEGFTIDEINNGALNKGYVPKSKSENAIYTFDNLGGFNCRGWWDLVE
jgi:hypothetical protein